MYTILHKQVFLSRATFIYRNKNTSIIFSMTKVSCSHTSRSSFNVGVTFLRIPTMQNNTGRCIFTTRIEIPEVLATEDLANCH
jgi:hypothetical protein